ncbi:MAG: hypothetical protein U0232_17770 [Thermomicrobiales bacterium]
MGGRRWRGGCRRGWGLGVLGPVQWAGCGGGDGGGLSGGELLIVAGWGRRAVGEAG